MGSPFTSMRVKRRHPGSSRPFSSLCQAPTMDDNGQDAADGWGCIENGSHEEDVHGFPGLLLLLYAAGLCWVCKQVPENPRDIHISCLPWFLSACSQGFNLPTRLATGSSPILSSTETRAIGWPHALNPQGLVQSEAQSLWKAC